MDDHLYEELMRYAENVLIPKVKEEYEKSGRLKECHSYEYEELRDLVKVLNIIAPYAGYSHKTVKELLDI